MNQTIMIKENKMTMKRVVLVKILLKIKESKLVKT